MVKIVQTVTSRTKSKQNNINMAEHDVEKLWNNAVGTRKVFFICIFTLTRGYCGFIPRIDDVVIIILLSLREYISYYYRCCRHRWKRFNVISSRFTRNSRIVFRLDEFQILLCLIIQNDARVLYIYIYRQQICLTNR